jgi:hypothetical protein
MRLLGCPMLSDLNPSLLDTSTISQKFVDSNPDWLARKTYERIEGVTLDGEGPGKKELEKKKTAKF